jgi:hypothetical protein
MLVTAHQNGRGLDRNTECYIYLSLRVEERQRMQFGPG